MKGIISRFLREAEGPLSQVTDKLEAVVSFFLAAWRALVGMVSFRMLTDMSSTRTMSGLCPQRW